MCELNGIEFDFENQNLGMMVHLHGEGFKALVYKWDATLVLQCRPWGTGALMCTVCLYAGQYLCYMSDLVD